MATEAHRAGGVSFGESNSVTLAVVARQADADAIDATLQRVDATGVEGWSRTTSIANEILAQCEGGVARIALATKLQKKCQKDSRMLLQQQRKSSICSHKLSAIVLQATLLLAMLK